MADNARTATSNSQQASGSQQEFGTLWIQDQNGVQQMIRVVQASSARLPATAVVASPAVSVPLAASPASSTGAAVPPGGSVVRAIIKTANPAGAAPVAGVAVAGGTAQVVRRVQVQPGTAIQTAVVGRAGTRPATQFVAMSPNNRAITTVLQHGQPTQQPRRTVLARRLPNSPKRRVLPTNMVSNSGGAGGISGASVPRSFVPTPLGGAAPLVPPSPLTASVSSFKPLSDGPAPASTAIGASAGAHPQEVLRPGAAGVVTVRTGPVGGVGGAAAAYASPLVDRRDLLKRQADSDAWGSVPKRGRPAKNNKGLRHFSMKVCEKVRTKGVTTYNEVADELVAEFSEDNANDSPSEQLGDQKNIRRRVYDALNVLMAMNIITRERKQIQWVGLPTNSLQECRALEWEKSKRIQRINQKTQQLKELILQQIAFKNLVERNRKAEEEQGAPPENTTVQLPFIVVNTSKKTIIDCSISSDKMEYLFSFDDTFEIHDDIEVLKRMGLAMGLENGTLCQEDIARAKDLVPPVLAPYVDLLARDGAAAPAGVGGGGDDDYSAEVEAASGGARDAGSYSERGESGTPSIDFDTDDEDDRLLEVDYDEDAD